jgi:hypothetical protein
LDCFLRVCDIFLVSERGKNAFDSLRGKTKESLGKEFMGLSRDVCHFQKGVVKEFRPWKDGRKPFVPPSSEKYCGVVEAGTYAYYRIEAPGPYLISLWNV